MSGARSRLQVLFRAWPRRLGGRAVLVLLATVLLIHLGSIAVHHEDAAEATDTVVASQMAGRLVTAARALSSLEPAVRDPAAHAMSSDMLALHWEGTAAVGADANPGPLQALRNRIVELAPSLGQFKLRLGYTQNAAADERQALLGTMILADGSYVNFSAHQTIPTPTRYHAALISTSLITAGVGGLAIVLMRRLISPVRRLASVVDAIGRGPVVSVPETGPDEIQHLARAFNDMQRRIRQLIADRTHALAAVSHDLRTPITRLRLRAGFVADEDVQQAMDADLDEMEDMIEATLHFLRDGVDIEQPKRIDLATLVATLVDDATDAGHAAEYQGPRHFPMLLRALSIKRALSNLIGNAIAYGNGAHVILVASADGVRVRVEDEGPGIPESALDRVFEPFERMDQSRNCGTGGAGLGLSIAKQAVEREGGTITLVNRREGGLAAEVYLPIAGAAAASPRNRVLSQDPLHPILTRSRGTIVPG